MNAELRFWKSVEELRSDAGAEGEVARDCFAGQRAQTGPPPPVSRRDFLTLAGFGLAAAAAACSRGSVQKAIPMLNQPEQMTPGVASYYATTCGGCGAGCALLVKTRDGRPIKIEGNAESAVFGGATCAAGQATVLSLYDDARLKGPLWRGQPAAWADVDAHVSARIAAAAAARKRVVLLSRTILGPSPWAADARKIVRMDRAALSARPTASPARPSCSRTCARIASA